MSNYAIVVSPDGDVRYVYDDALIALMEMGQAQTRRASHVEPCEGGWAADMSPCGGPVLPPAPTRAEALAQEIRWLLENGLPVPKE